MTQLYEKRGRRYIPWGNGDRWGVEYDAMAVGSCRLIYCPDPGHYRIGYDVTPNTAAFMAAAMVAEQAMEDAINATARASPSAGQGAYTPEQRAIIEQFSADMAATGALVPSYWSNATAAEIARAGIEAVKRAAGIDQ